MKSNKIRTAIPAAYGDLNAWPRPDETLMGDDQLKSYISRRIAIEMYGAWSSFTSISQETGKSKSEVFRLLKRCLTIAPDGQIYGFRALPASVRIATYCRTQEVNHAPGSGSGGCAGALTRLFGRYPEIEDLVKNLYFKRPEGGMHEARIALKDIHTKFKAALRALRLTDHHWPFNTSNEGYKSLCEYCNRLRDGEPRSAVGPRSGADASRRNTIGTGVRPLLPCLRPYSAVQLDFHKVDSASVIVLENDHGTLFEVPLARWHFGLMADEKSGAILGFCVALELTPSSDSTLEVVSSALSAGTKDVADVHVISPDHVLINQLMPELACQGFSILKVDNGWSNAAHEVVNNIIRTVGCAVNFGPTRAWWRRNMIERIFGELTRRGLQRLPSTHGSGAADTRRSNANEKAAQFRISLEDLVALFKRCVREHNLADTEGKQWSSPLQCLRAAYGNPRSGFFSQPLPASVQAHPGLMMHIEEVTVRGNVKEGVRPYFKLDRHRHTNEVLAHSYWLIGKVLVVYVDRHLARMVYATVKDTGEQLGRMIPAGPWADSDCSWRDRKLMSRAGMNRTYSDVSTDPLEELKQEKIAQLKASKRASRFKSSKTGLDVARMTAQQKRAAAAQAMAVDEQAPEDEEIESAPLGGIGPDPFGLHGLPTHFED